MSALILGHDEALARWCAARIPHVGAAGFGPCRAVGVATGNDEKDKLLAVVVYHDFQPACGTVQISCAAASPKWAGSDTIRRLLAVPFRQFGVRKVWVAIPDDNARAIRFNAGIGMVREATLRHHFGHKRHAVILSMLAREFAARWERHSAPRSGQMGAP